MPAGERRAGWLVGESELVELIRTREWGRSELGPIEDWPESLRTTVSLCLSSSFPINVIWGPRYVQIWNEAYAKVCGDKHPGELGSDYRECWASAWPAIGGAFDAACAGEAAFLENQPMFLDRNGYLEETFFTFSLSPIRDESGEVAGLFHPVTETTPRMLSERRIRMLRDLDSRAARAHTVADAVRLACEVLADAGQDLPFVLLYLLDGDGRHARLDGQSGLDAAHRIKPATFDLEDAGDSEWLAGVMRSGEALEIADLSARFGAVHAGPYPEATERALVLPLIPPGASHPAGVVVAGISSRLPLDEVYRGFVDLVAAGVTNLLANATAYERERDRVRALAELDRAKTDFFSNVSHEFRTPLTLILGPLEHELAESAGCESARRERLETAHRNSLRLLRLVNSLLDLSRVESGPQRASFCETDLAALTAEVASGFEFAVAQAGLELVVDCPPLPEPVFVDRDLWEKIVLNLISNAFKHTFAGTITVTLVWRGDRAELMVSDTGVGIAGDELPRLFERFHQVKGARSRSLEGSGIGLALVQELARLHGGDVTVASTPGVGSTFTVTVRAGRAHLPVDQLATGPRSRLDQTTSKAFSDEALGWLADADAPGAGDGDGAPGDNGSSSPRPRVLLADDNADMRSHVRGLLEPRFAVTAVADGAAALAAAVAEPPDVVLTDVMMPVLDGFGLLAGLRADERTRTVPVIIISARAGEEAVIDGVIAGADDYLAKPFSARELTARVSRSVALARLRREFVEQLQAANQELALRVIEREEAERRVRSLNGELAAANHELASWAEVIGRLAGGVAHELNNKLTVILGFNDVVARRIGELDPLHGAVGEIRDAADHSAALTRDLLAFARRQILAPEALSVAEISAGLRRLLAPAVGEHIELIIDDRSAGALVWADHAQLERAVLQIALNACDAMPDGGRLTIRTTTTEGLDPQGNRPGQATVRIELSDTGRGIPDEMRGRIFEPFFTTKGVGEGTGLGLAAARGIIEQSGGTLTVSSRPGHGSSFFVALPQLAARTVEASPDRMSP